MSHTPLFDDEMAALEKIASDHPDHTFEFNLKNFDPRDVPSDYEQINGDLTVWFEKRIGKSIINLWIDSGWITTGKASLKSF